MVDASGPCSTIHDIAVRCGQRDGVGSQHRAAPMRDRRIWNEGLHPDHTDAGAMRQVREPLDPRLLTTSSNQSGDAALDESMLERMVAIYDRGLLVPFIGAGMSYPSCRLWDRFVGE